MNPDIFNRTYTAEIIRTPEDAEKTLNTITDLTIERRFSEQIEGEHRVTLFHSFIASDTRYHRTIRTIATSEQGTRTIPRTREAYGKLQYIYDVLIAQCGSDIIIAVPYHGLAENFFVQVDEALAGKGVLYEKLNITNIVIWLGETGTADISTEGVDNKTEIVLTRCQLAYTDPVERKQDLQRVTMTGGNLGASKIYSYLINPILSPTKHQHKITPTTLGFSLHINGVKKTSATTDRHGNFKLWIGPNASRIVRVFSLLKGIEKLKGNIVTTGSLPILQSKSIRGEDF